MKLATICLAAATTLTLAGCAVQPPVQQRTQAGYGDAPYQQDGRYANDPYRDGRHSEGPYNDGRYADTAYHNGRYQSELYFDERAQRYFYIDERTGDSYWRNGEPRSR
ncbi:MAG: hypothetical protein RIB03_04415 [Henriciella sp.]|uniref:hypothetical protein n=1 Tax=Henriciella sp. TaxID=1968823 RepID=UPI0032EF2E0A